MRIVHRTRRGERVVDVDIDDHHRTVGELLVALAEADVFDAQVEPVIDGAPVTADSPLSVVALCEGSVVDTTGEPLAGPAPVRTLAVIGGLRAGAVVDAGRAVVIGRGPDADLRLHDAALSRRHVSLCGDLVADLGSRNGTSIDGHPVVGPAPLCDGAVLRAGLSRFSARSAVDDRPAAVVAGLGVRGGAIPFNRPPRLAPPSSAESVVAPGPAPLPAATEPLSVAGIVLPIIAGAVVAVLFSPFMAVFAALGPVLTVGTWWERRRRNRRDHRRDLREFTEMLESVCDALPGHRHREIFRRRTLHPDPAEVLRRAEGPSVRLWERRRSAVDAFTVGLGVRDEPFTPDLVAPAGETVSAEVLDAVAAMPLMPDVPVPVDLGPGRVVGIVGESRAARSVARSLMLQMATHHGPADLSMVVGADAIHEWGWASWLPHTADHASGRRGVALLETNDAGAALEVLAAAGDRALLAVLDGDDPFQGRTTVGRHLLACEQASAIVLVRDEHRLTARCDTVVRIDGVGRMSIVDPRRAEAGSAALAWGVSVTIATRAARRLARLDDPELPIVGTGVPGAAPLLGLLGISGDDPREIEERWRATDGSADLRVPIGADGDGATMLDFVDDGPHVLVGGTTGSGKSELLRSIVAAVAATADPDHVAMVLVDYKGGAAFDCCADLPHVAGLVTDLDAELAARALRCLEAELRYREHRLRAVGADNMASFRLAAESDPKSEPLPRLIVVVDEFASLAADLPEFLDALVGIAQRGRSLGVHMILATQRPAGVVTDDIRANTACRIALRVTDRGDSLDVIDAPDAAAIPRSRPGRGVARFGPGELVPFQAALVTGHSRGAGGISVNSPIEAPPSSDTATSDLGRLVAAVGAAHRARGGQPPRAPWPPPLPVDLRRESLPRAGNDQWCLIDEPDDQTQRFGGWLPDDGHLVVVGGPGAGSTTTLATAALAAGGEPGLHIHAIDLDAGGLLPLAGLVSAGTIVGPSDAVRRVRLLRWIDEEVQRRRSHPSNPGPGLLLLIDDLGGLGRAHDPVREPLVHERLGRIWADGPAVGVVIATSLRRAADLAPSLAATTGAVMIHRSADQSDALRFGLKVSTADFPPGRAVDSAGKTLQVIRAAESIEAAVAERRGDTSPSTPPHEVGELHTTIRFNDVTPSVELTPNGAVLSCMVRERDLSLGAVRLHRREHAVVLGPPRSGRTNVLCCLARAAGSAAVVVGDGDLARRSGVVAIDPADLDGVLESLEFALVLVDDMLDLDDPTGALGRVVAAAPPGVHLVGAARPDQFRSSYGHWAAEIKRSRAGVLLRPDPMDGDILGQQFPARLGIAAVAGRGVMVSEGETEVVQCVLAEGQSTS